MKPNDTDKNMNPTKEECNHWRKRLSSQFTCFNAAHADFTLRLLDALEEAEANREKMNQEADVLSIWLANVYIDIDLLPDIDSGAMNPPLPEDVREAAREAARKDELQT